MKALLAVSVLLVAGCGSETIDLTRAVPGQNEGSIGMPCASQVECGPDSFCERKACGDATGKCSALPTECRANVELVCGCNGITYVNDCVRAAYGVTGSLRGPCSLEGPVSVP